MRAASLQTNESLSFWSDRPNLDLNQPLAEGDDDVDAASLRLTLESGPFALDALSGIEGP